MHISGTGAAAPLAPGRPARDAAAAPAARDDDAARVAREFEAVFLSETVDAMMRDIDMGSFGGGHAEDLWRSFLGRAIADEIAAQGTTGIAQRIEAGIAAYRDRIDR